jgi:hypothetical protein
MPQPDVPIPDASPRARHYVSIAQTHARARAALDELRDGRDRFVKTAASLAIERRILREDYACSSVRETASTGPDDDR